MTQAIPPKHIVLYADDDPDDIQLVSESFEKYAQNVEIVTVNDGIGVLTYLDQLSPFSPSPCLVILDINMPLLTGKDVLIRIRDNDKFSDVPVILFTTSSLPSDMAFAEKYKAGFITKPLNAAQMARITNEFIEHCADDIKKIIRKQIS
jgi:CheY-like chemotaxis protein